MSVLAVAYANALLEIGESTNQSQELYEQCETLKTLFTTFPQYQNLLGSPLLAKQEKKQLLQEWLTLAPTCLQNVFYLLCDKAQTNLIVDILENYIKNYQEQYNILPVTVVSAVEVPAALLQELKQVLEVKFQKTVLLQNKIDLSCIGGLQLQMKGTQYDSSIQTRLENIHKILSEI